MSLPIPFPASTISLPYGAVDGEFYTFSSPHQGTDFSSRSQGVTAGTVFRASGPGRVVRSGVGPVGVSPSITRPNNLAGNSIDVDYGDFIARYMHRPYDSPSPSVGAATVEGTLLGVVGATGLGDGGAHLHMETWDKRTGRRVNPATYFDFTRVVDASAAAGDGSSTPFNPGKPKEWDEMATKEEVKSAVLEALGARPDTVLIHYSGEGRNGIYLAAPGFWHQFTAEQWTQFVNHGLRTGIREVIPVNDRDFDVFREIYAPKTTPA